MPSKPNRKIIISKESNDGYKRQNWRIGNNDEKDNNYLLGNFITKEELWACTTCNACTDACPINLDPLSIIVDLRRYLVMEESSAPTELNNMFSNVENNGAPWQFSAADRLKWVDENNHKEN